MCKAHKLCFFFLQPTTFVCHSLVLTFVTLVFLIIFSSFSFEIQFYIILTNSFIHYLRYVHRMHKHQSITSRYSLIKCELITCLAVTSLLHTNLNKFFLYPKQSIPDQALGMVFVLDSTWK